MHLFQIIGDLLHLSSFIIIINQIKKKKTVVELSYRTQEIYLVVFLTRYYDLFLYYISLYNTTFKILFITLTIYIIYLIKFSKPYCLGYDKNLDSFNHYLYVYPTAFILTLVFHVTIYGYYEYFYTFSLWLEALAILPQLIIVNKKKEVEIITGTYMAFLGFYRLFYIMNWIFIYIQQDEMIWIKFIAGIIQTGLYLDFLYYYIISAKNNSILCKLPI